MKTNLVGMLILSIFLNSCMLSYKSPFAHDYRDNVQFNEFQTYAFFTNLDESSLSKENSDFIKNSIAKRIEMLGYTYDEINPDIIIAHTLFNNKLNFHGFIETTNPQISDEHYGEKVCTPVTYKLKKGALLIQIIDNKAQECIWQGYNTTNNNNQASNSSQLNYSISQILEQYRIYSMGIVDRTQQFAQAR